MRYLLVMLLVLGLAVPQVGVAQSLNTAMWGSVSKGHLNATRSVNRQLYSPAPTAPRTQSSSDFRYRYDRSRTQENLDRFVERTPVEAGQAELRQMLAAQPGLMQTIRSGIVSYGFDPDNLADVYALWWMNVWMTANKQDEDPDNGTIAMVKQQVRSAFAATRDLEGTTDAERQEYAEALMLQASMLSSAFNEYKNNPAKLDELAAAAQQGAKASGLDLSTMTLTRNGFVPRQGADASDASNNALPGGEEAVRNAAADSDDNSSMALALAAGAGLGAVLLGGAVFMRRQG